MGNFIVTWATVMRLLDGYMGCSHVLAKLLHAMVMLRIRVCLPLVHTAMNVEHL